MEKTNDYPPFSGDDPYCPKCGHRGATTKYMLTGYCVDGTSTVMDMEYNERLHRECRRCDYPWDEAVFVVQP